MRPLFALSSLTAAAAVLSLAAATPTLVYAQTTSSVPVTVRAAIRDASGAVTIPITLRGGHIFLDASINGKPARLVFDSGAGANVLTPEGAAKLGVTSDGTAARAQGAGGNIAVSRGVVERLALGAKGDGASGGAVLEGELAYIIPMPPELECDGLIGGGLLQRFVATIDYEKQTLTLTDPKRFQAPAGADTLALFVDQGLPTIDGTVDGITGKFRLDTGANDALTLFSPFVEKNKLRDHYHPSIETMTGKGVGGYLYGDLVRIPTLNLGAAQLTGIVSELSRQKTGVFAQPGIAGNIGAEVLSRFAVTLDYTNKKLYLVRNARFGERFSGSRSGIGFDYDKGKAVVVAVIPSSPAADAGIKVGDTLLAVDGVGMDQMDSAKVRAKLRGSAGSKIEILIRSSDTETPRKVTVTLRELL